MATVTTTEAQTHLEHNDVLPENQPERCDLPILGMHCAACATRLEKALNKAPGVQQAGVNYATARATVHYDPQATNIQQLSDVVKKAGYEAIVAPARSTSEHDHAAHHEADNEQESVREIEAQAREKEYHRQKRQFTLALALTIPVAFLAMGSHFIPALQSTFHAPGACGLS
jgi:Cu+-exporting ATPase